MNEETKGATLPGQAVLPVMRWRMRWGFGLCGVALGLALVYIAFRFGAAILGASLHIDLESTYKTELVTLESMVEAATDLLFIVGLVYLYRVADETRWRWASRLLLLMSGADVASLVLRVASGDSPLGNVVGTLCSGLGWVEFWMLSVLSAEAAERIERPDITYETEVIGRLIIGGAFAWLGLTAWTFKLTPIAASAVPEGTDNLGMILGVATAILQLIILARCTLCCARLVRA